MGIKYKLTAKDNASQVLARVTKTWLWYKRKETVEKDRCVGKW